MKVRLVTSAATSGRFRGRIQALRVLDWRKRQSSLARVEDVIEAVLDPDLPRACDKPLYEQ